MYSRLILVSLKEVLLINWSDSDVDSGLHAGKCDVDHNKMCLGGNLTVVDRSHPEHFVSRPYLLTGYILKKIIQVIIVDRVHPGKIIQVIIVDRSHPEHFVSRPYLLTGYILKKNIQVIIVDMLHPGKIIQVIVADKLHPDKKLSSHNC